MSSERQKEFYETFQSSSSPKSESQKIEIETEEYSSGLVHALKPSQIFSSFLWLAILSLWNFIMTISEVLSNWIVNGEFILTLETLIYFIFNVLFVLMIFIGLYYLPRLSKRTYSRITYGLLGILSGLIIVALNIYYALNLNLSETIWLIPIPLALVLLTLKEVQNLPFNLSGFYLLCFLSALGICDLIFFVDHRIALLDLSNSWLSILMVYILGIAIGMGFGLIGKAKLPQAKSFEFGKIKIQTKRD